MPGSLDADHTLNRDGKLILDESDSYGVEMALQLVDAAGGGEVTLVSMAPNNEVSGLRTALAMGAAKAILVSDPALEGSDALSTAKVLAKAIERAGEVDLVLAATESSDGYTGTVPAQVGELLGWPALTFSKHVEIADGKVKVQRQTEAGYDIVEASLPAIVSVTAGVVEPRYPSFKGIMAAKNKPVDQVTAADLGLDAGQVGWAGARQEITNVAAGARPRSRREVRRRRDRRREGRRVPRAAEGGLRWRSGKSGSTPRRMPRRSTTPTLELLTKAREIGTHRRGDLRGQEPDRRGRRVGGRVRRDEAARHRRR